MRSSFKIPLQSEVQAYIKDKMGWPDSFVKHYSEKFWNHYQASGWKLSSGNLIKDWKACFNSQWKVPKFKEDIEMLYGKHVITDTSVKPAPPKPSGKVEELDQFLQSYVDRPTQIPFEAFGKWYDFMKAEKLLKAMTLKDIENLKAIYKNDFQKCRCACVQITLDGYVKGGITVATIFELRMKLA